MQRALPSAGSSQLTTMPGLGWTRTFLAARYILSDLRILWRFFLFPIICMTLGLPKVLMQWSDIHFILVVLQGLFGSLNLWGNE